MRPHRFPLTAGQRLLPTVGAAPGAAGGTGAMFWAEMYSPTAFCNARPSALPCPAKSPPCCAVRNWPSAELMSLTACCKAGTTAPRRRPRHGLGTAGGVGRTSADCWADAAGNTWFSASSSREPKPDLVAEARQKRPGQLRERGVLVGPARCRPARRSSRPPATGKVSRLR